MIFSVVLFITGTQAICVVHDKGFNHRNVGGVKTAEHQHTSGSRSFRPSMAALMLPL